jgi:hypothetical protein
MQMNESYEVARVWAGTRWRMDYVHRIVWIANNGPIPSGMIVHHKDGDKHNNSIENLELLTKKQHCALHGVLYTKNKDSAGKTVEEIYGEEAGKELRKKISKTKTGKKLSPEHIKRISEGLMGHGFTDEARAKMSEKAKARIRKPWSDEVKEKMSESAKARWRREKE